MGSHLLSTNSAALPFLTVDCTRYTCANWGQVGVVRAAVSTAEVKAKIQLDITKPSLRTKDPHKPTNWKKTQLQAWHKQRVSGMPHPNSGVAVLVLAINMHLLHPADHSADAIACVQPHLPGLGIGDDNSIQLQHPLVMAPL